jgi:uncharacterized membrane protein
MQVISVTTGNPIVYSFKTITFGQFQAELDRLEDTKQLKDRKERNRITEEVASALIENAAQIFAEASSPDVHRILVEAIEFNQGSEADAKKSE